MTITFTALRTFHAVVTEQGFSAAARALGIGQPTVTKQIKDIETEYRVELFLRRGRKVKLTEAGAQLHDIAKRIVQLRLEAHEHLSMFGKNARGHLRLAAVGPRCATDVLGTFKQQYPDFEVSVLIGNSERTLKRLLDLDADVAIVAETIEDSRVKLLHYRTDQVVILVGKSHAWYGRESIRLKEMEGQPFVLREKGSTTRTVLERALRHAGISIKPAFEISGREGVSRAVERGFGIGVVAGFEFTEYPNLHTVHIADLPIEVEYFVAYLADRENSSKLRAFIDSVVAPR